MNLWKQLLAGLVMTMLAACTAPDGRVVIKLPNQQEIWAEIALSAEEQERGLMGREVLGDKDGMIFAYDSPRMMTFWMKNTLIPLDILFVDEQRQIVDIQTMEPCLGDPCTTYPSRAAAQYAIEIGAGKAAEWGLKIGDQLSFDIPEPETP